MLILPPFSVGETAVLYGPRDFSCAVIDPDDEWYVLGSPLKRVEIPLARAGTYQYAWPDGTTGELIAEASQPPSGVVGA